LAKAATKRDREPESGEGTGASAPEDLEDERVLAFLSDIPIRVSVQLDHRLVSVAEILDLKVDSIVKMERSAGENVDLLLEGMTAGNGEIVVIEDMMGLRITDLALDGKTAPAR
jgi:flagellar motor switch protein FliN/FliY